MDCLPAASEGRRQMTPPPTSPTDGEPGRALTGLVVLDLTRYIAGPYCTMLLADGGATVIKIEPTYGEDTRHLEPFIESASGELISAYFMRFNRGKRSVGLDLKSPEGATLMGSSDLSGQRASRG
jgi:CoA:oxalate CoA-transferase